MPLHSAYQIPCSFVSRTRSVPGSFGNLKDYREEFQDYQELSPQEIRYRIGEKIRMNIIISRLRQNIKTIKKIIVQKGLLRVYAQVRLLIKMLDS